MKVRDLMSTQLFTLRSEHNLSLADDIMEWQNIRHIPVVNKKGELAGLVTHRDLLKASLSSLSQVSKKEQRELLNKVRIGDIMKTEVFTVASNDDLRDAAATMIDEKLGCLPVVDEKKLVGILTEADFLTLAWEAMGGKAVQKDFTSARKYTRASRAS